MTTRILAGLYDDYEDAQATARDLEEAGVPYEDLSILTNHSDGRAGNIDTPPGAESGARAGVATGAVLGAGAGLLAGLTILALPAVGAVAATGWVIATLVGAGAGAGFGSAAGGLVGGLAESGLTRDEAHFFAEVVRRGGTVLLVKASPERAAVIEPILQRHTPIDRMARERAYREGGWTEFDEKAPVLTTAEIQGDRELHAAYRGPQYPPVDRL